MPGPTASSPESPAAASTAGASGPSAAATCSAGADTVGVPPARSRAGCVAGGDAGASGCSPGDALASSWCFHCQVPCPTAAAPEPPGAANAVGTSGPGADGTTCAASAASVTDPEGSDAAVAPPAHACASCVAGGDAGACRCGPSDALFAGASPGALDTAEAAGVSGPGAEGTAGAARATGPTGNGAAGVPPTCGRASRVISGCIPDGAWVMSWRSRCQALGPAAEAYWLVGVGGHVAFESLTSLLCAGCGVVGPVAEGGGLPSFAMGPAGLVARMACAAGAAAPAPGEVIS